MCGKQQKWTRQAAEVDAASVQMVPMVLMGPAA